MHNICLFGAGKIGEAITALVSMSGRYKIKVCDIDERRAAEVAGAFKNTESAKLDLGNKSSIEAVLKGADAVLSALPYHCNVPVAEAAVRAGVHYFDLTEDVSVTKAVQNLAANANTVLMPQCGLAPGFISIAAFDLARGFDSIESIKMRVGALPLYPSNTLKYNLTWSTDGLINEYGNLCDAIIEGKRIQVLPLEGCEKFSLDGVEYEAFNTSGGLGTLADQFEGKVKELTYKTCRYPGHRDLVAFLMNDLRLNHDRETLKRIFENSIPGTAQDKCLIFVEVRGSQRGKFIQKTYASNVHNTAVGGKHLTAIQLTTAAGICAPVDLFLTGELGKKKGFLRSEEIPLNLFLQNEFGRHYAEQER